MENINQRKYLDKSNYVKSINESKISKRKKTRNDNNGIRDNTVSHSEFISGYSMTSDYENSSVIMLNIDCENLNKEGTDNNKISETKKEVNLDSHEVKSNKMNLNNKNYIDQNNIITINRKKQSDLNSDIKDLSIITQKDNFYIKESIHNSIFNSDNVSSIKIEELETNNINDNILNDSRLLANTHIEKQLGEIFFQKILNATHNEEILLPEIPIKIKCLLINKPVRIIGQPNCTLEITEGPISINIAENFENELVKFSQVKIKFDITQTEQSIIKNYRGDHAKFTVLFRLYPGSLVEIEDCDITCIKDNSIPISRHKLICFQLMYCKYLGKNLNTNKIKESKNEMYISNPEMNSPTILTIISSKIERFYQTIRAAENCIINIEKSFINRNIGKSIAILNPLILKIVGSTFEGNGENAVHIKFVKDDNLQDNRKIFFKNNEFSYNFGTGIYLDGIENVIIDLDIVIDGNLFKKNKGDSIIMLDLFVKSLIISNNKFFYGKLNGLNINRVYQKNNTNSQNTNALTSASYTQDLPIEMKENEFIENEGFGIIINDCKAQIVKNNFFQNRACGLLLVNINNSENNSVKSQPSNQHLINTSAIGIESSVGNLSSFSLSNGTCYLFKNSFWKNGGCGLKIVNYNYFVLASECYFKENVEYGVFIEIDNSINMLNQNNPNSQNSQNQNILSTDKIKAFRDADNSKVPNDTNLFLLNSTIVNNMKSGIYFNNSFIFLENTIISDNLDYAILIPREEFRYCYKESKLNQKNLINGNIGGTWGEITISSKTFCNSCTSTSKIKKFHNNKNSNTINSNPNIHLGPENLSNPQNINPNITTPKNLKISTNKAHSDNSNAVKNNDNSNNSKCLIS